jgi:hypothetical protein
VDAPGATIQFIVFLDLVKMGDYQSKSISLNELYYRSGY